MAILFVWLSGILNFDTLVWAEKISIGTNMGGTYIHRRRGSHEQANPRPGTSNKQGQTSSNYGCLKEYKTLIEAKKRGEIAMNAKHTCLPAATHRS
jgi:hypothetical protein